MTTPRIACLGVGWIGRHRMRAVAASGAAEIVAVADVDPAAAAEAAAEVGAAVLDVDEVLRATGVDGLMIATPSALHAEQAIAALDRGVAVFCQKPLGRNECEARAVTDAARRNRRRLDVDLSYRHLDATRRAREVVASGEIGDVYAAELVFHNAYGPDKAWFLDRSLSGGGCVIDLGTHLVDLAAWVLGTSGVHVSAARRYERGQRLGAGADAVEDFATATLDTDGGTTISLACSWFLHAGRDAAIRATFHGTEGAVSVENVGGSFYDFEAVRHRGTAREVLAAPPDEWGGRAAVAWAQRIRCASADDDLDELVAVARLIDAIYAA